MFKFYFLFLFCLFPVALRAGIAFDVPFVTAPCEGGQAVVNAELPFRVEGNSAVTIVSIRTGCDCTTGVADAASYAPGAKGKIKLVFTVGERTGFQRKTISVKTSDGKEAAAFFQTTIPAILEIKPAFVFWKKGEVATVKQVAVKVVLADKPVKVLSAVATPADAFSVELQAVTVKGNGSGSVPPKKGRPEAVQVPHLPGEYILRITPKKTDVPLTARIVLKTDFPADAGERFVVVATVR